MGTQIVSTPSQTTKPAVLRIFSGIGVNFISVSSHLGLATFLTRWNHFLTIQTDLKLTDVAFFTL
ncbi:MAG: hypothetical protein ACI936_000727 [Paraglaciecola sp.]